jgi:hypothetical protein
MRPAVSRGPPASIAGDGPHEVAPNMRSGEGIGAGGAVRTLGGSAIQHAGM